MPQELITISPALVRGIGVKVVVLISGMLGAGCTSIALELGRRMELKVVNTESIVREIVAEKKLSFMELAAMVRDGEVDLEGVIRSIALDYVKEGGVVIEGRTALMMLDRPATLKVFLYADEGVRARRVAERRGISLDEAREEVERSDEDRRSLVMRLYRREWMDPSLYDLMLNTTRLSLEEAIGAVEAVYRDRSGV
ncbi:MAG: hypothetical protein DRJ43_02750 [Thermoprotei archaeon]|nr:MAG: hypothetical protein DRJ43_02750 [Thermoprotei archaeon]